MRLYLKCVPCCINQVLQAAELSGVDAETEEKMLREALDAAKDFKFGEHTFHTYNRIQEVIRKHKTKDDPYRKLKKQFNDICLQLEKEYEKLVEKSPDGFQTALKIAIAGNIIDFARGWDMNKQKIRRIVKETLEKKLDQETVKLLKRKTEKAQKILYIGDNAGEIVFDKIFIKQLDLSKVVFAVRGGPILNDATFQDAEETGLTKLVKVIDTGIDLPGAMVELSTPEFKDEFKNADVVIAKGQGNYEALSEESRDIFYLLKIKCQVISKDLGEDYQLGDIVIHYSK